MKCINCGTELSGDIRFCPQCGKKLFDENNHAERRVNDVAEIECQLSENERNNALEVTLLENTTSSASDVTSSGRSNSVIKNRWIKATFFEKVVAVGMGLSAFLGLFAFLFGRIFAGIVSVCWFAIIVVAMLMKKNVIKAPKTWVALLIAILSFAMIVPYFSLFKVNIADYERFNWNEIVLSDMLPKPSSTYGEIYFNTDSYLSINTIKVTPNQYYQYVEDCKQKGFVIDAETTDSTYVAYNDKGYKLSLYYFEHSGEMSIDLSAGMKLELFSWPSSEMAQMLPVPTSNIGKVNQDDEARLSVYVGEMTIDEFNTYVSACIDKGFDVETSRTEKRFGAQNIDGVRLTVCYEGNSIVYITLDEPVYDVSIEIKCVENLIFSKYDIDVYVDGSFETTILHGETETIDLTLTKGLYLLKFVDAEDEEVYGEVELEVVSDTRFEFELWCTSTGIDIETVSGIDEENTTPESSDPSEADVSIVTMTMSEEGFKGMSSNEAERLLGDMGFSSFEHKSVDTEDEAAEGTICYVEIKEFFLGDSSFVEGDTFSTDSTVTLYIYKYVEPEVPSPVFYSTNDYETAKEGNTGIFSYRNRAGSYDIYWIIDFDEGYVYYFTDGDGESFCDRLKIDSGTLNDVVIATYHDGGDSWSYKFHFKYVNHPETLIMVDQNGFDFECSTTDLSDAFDLRDTKNINDY